MPKRPNSLSQRCYRGFIFGAFAKIRVCDLLLSTHVLLSYFSARAEARRSPCLEAIITHFWVLPLKRYSTSEFFILRILYIYNLY